MVTLLSVLAAFGAGVVVGFWCHTLWAWGLLGAVCGAEIGVLLAGRRRLMAAGVGAAYLAVLWWGRC